MRRRALGAREVSVIGQGTWNLERADEDEALAALRRGIELGMDHVDTAEMYGGGAVEALLGRALEGFPEVFVTSKVLPSNATRSGTIAACERSLARLRRERIDLYLLHWPGPHPLEETVAGFEALVEAGKIGAWGVSNFDAAELEEALRLAGPAGPACDQVLYHVAERAVEHRVLPRCAEHGLALAAYSPFGSGDFPAPGSPGGRALAEVGRAVGATPRQVALAFLTRHPCALAIPKAARPEHVEENAAAGGLELGEEALRALEGALPRGPEPPSLPVI